MHLYLAFLLGNDYTLPENKSSVDVLRMPFFSAMSNEGLTETAPTSRTFMSFLGANFFKNKMSNLTGTKTEFWTKKFSRGQFSASEDKAWQGRLVIVTERRIFIVTQKKLGDGSVTAASQPTGLVHHSARSVDLEILDSIPVEEITSIR